VVRKITFTASLLVLLLALVPASLLYYLGYTEPGLQFIVTRLPERLGPVTMHAEGATGTLAGGMTLRHFELEHELVSLRVANVAGRVRMLPLLWQTIEVEDGRVGHARIAIHARRKPPLRRTPRFLPAFLSVEIPGAELERATLVAINGTVLEFSDVSAAGTIRSRTIRFYRAGAKLGDLRFDAIGLLTAAAPMQIEASSRVSYAPPGLPRWVMNGDLAGNLAAIGITGELAQPFRATLTEGVLKALGTWGFTGRAQVFDFDLQAFGAGPLLGKVSGNLALGIDRQGYRASGTLDSSGLGVGAFNVAFDGSYAKRVLTSRRIVLVHRGSGARVEAAGQAEPRSVGHDADVAGRWQDFRWPLAGAEPVVRSAEGSFRLGEVWPYALQLEGPVEPVPLGIAPPP
jgi:hypothetical protein